MLAFVSALILHTLAALVWVGGMFFAHVILRPALLEMAPPDRLKMWGRVFARFFPWVWASIVVLVVTGYGVLFLGYRGGVTGGGTHIDIMQVTGLIMVANFVFLFWGPYGKFKRALDAEDWPGAADAQGRIRRIVVINLGLGLFTVVVGATGTLWAY